MPIGARVRRWLVERIVGILTQPLAAYEQRVPNDLIKLARHLRKGDVILVEGDQRVSVVIKYLTQSSWSHSALYIGDELLRRSPERQDELRERFGDEAGRLVVEALMEGVVVSPLSKYAAFNLRVCRPYNIRREDLGRVVDAVMARIGQKYDLRNVVDLARYFFPVSLIPRRFRRRALLFGSGLPTEVICSSMIALAFQDVGFPILPRVVASDTPLPPRTALERLLGRYPAPTRRYFRQSPTLVTPREFDLSPYFEIIKFNFIEDTKFDYRKILWTEEDKASAG
ncbi:MAG: hypothetical protein QOD06_147 [Candidatus Binatota bacterium]|jgi:hypothetical protein|nr:hypothetical protein [Candidatus Binatota bacterium]